MGTEVAVEIPLEKRNLPPSWHINFVSIFCQPEWGDTQVYVGFDAVITDSTQVDFDTVGADFIFLLNLFKKWHLWFWLLVSLPSPPDLSFLCLTCFLKLLVEFSVLSPIFSLLRLSYLYCLCKGLPSLAWWEDREDAKWGWIPAQVLPLRNLPFCL